MDKDEHKKNIVEAVLRDTAFKIHADKKSKYLKSELAL